MGSGADDRLSHHAVRRTKRCVLIAVKQRARSKTRLSEVLTGESRLTLVRAMLHSVLQAARAAYEPDEVRVLSPERDDIPSDIRVLRDRGDSLNAGLSRARSRLAAQGYRELLVLPADLPTLTAAEIRALVDAGRRHDVAVAPDIAGSGTNALWVPCSVPFRFRFGPGSCERHLAEAARLGLSATLVHRPGLAFDVDTPADLTRWQDLTGAVRRRA